MRRLPCEAAVFLYFSLHLPPQLPLLHLAQFASHSQWHNFCLCEGRNSCHAGRGLEAVVRSDSPFLSFVDRFEVEISQIHVAVR